MPPVFSTCNVSINSFPQGVTQINLTTDFSTFIYEAPSTKSVDYVMFLRNIEVLCPEGTILPNMELLGVVKTQSEDSTYDSTRGAYVYDLGELTITGDFDITFASAPTSSNKISIGSLPLSKMLVGTAEVAKAILNGVTLYESAEKLDAPANVSVNGTEVTFDEVENAESYDILVDGNSIGEYTPQSGYTVTITDNRWDVPVAVYDGIDDTGVYLGTLEPISAFQYGMTATITSGNMYLEAQGGYFSSVDTPTGGVSITDGGAGDTYIVCSVNADGTITVYAHE